MKTKYLGRLLTLGAALVALSGCKAVDGISSLLPGATVENSKADNALILDYSPRYLGHEIASGRSESNVWSVANTD